MAKQLERAICQKIFDVQIRNPPSVNPMDIYRPGSSQPCLQPEQQRPFFPSQLHQNCGAGVLSKVLNWNTLGQGLSELLHWLQGQQWCLSTRGFARPWLGVCSSCSSSSLLAHGPLPCCNSTFTDTRSEL